MNYLEELYIQELSSREAFNEAFIYNKQKDILLDEAVSIVNEAYIGKTPVLEEIEDLISQIRGKINRYKDFDRMKEVQALNRLFEKQFGMDVFALHMIPENVMNAYTCVIARNFDVYRRKNFSDYLVADRKDGFRFRSDNNFCIIANVYYGLFTNPDLTDGEILAIILHEIGHNFADFLDDNIRLANQYIMDSWMATNIAQIIIDAIQLNIIGVIGDISNVIQGLTMMNNFKKNKMEKINQKGKERTISPTLKGLSGKTSDFFGTCANILYKYNIITLGFKGIGKLFRKPFENFLKKSAKQSVDRRNEIIADKFATVYGYGPELTTGLQKMSSYKSKDYTIIDKLPFGKKFNEAWDKLYLDINEFDCHPHDIQRANECIKTLKDELEQEDMDPKLKSVIYSQINAIESNINNIKDMVNKDPNNIKVVYDAYIANELPDATTKAIEDEINKEFNDIIRESVYDDKSFLNEGLLSIIKKWNDNSLENEKIDREKQRAKELGLTQDQYKRYMNYKLDSEYLKKANEMFNNFRKYTLDLFKKLKSDSEFKKKVQNVYDKYINDDSVELSKFPPLKIFDFDKIGKDGEGQIMIFNNGDDSIYYGFIYDYIKKDMKENHKDIDFIYNTGDGDEGSIWVNVWTEKYKKYIINKIKSQSVN